MAVDTAAVFSLGVNVLLYIFIYDLATKLKIDFDLISRNDKKNSARIKADALVRLLILVLAFLMNLTVVGFTWYFANEVDSQLALMAFVHFIFNVVGIIALSFVAGLRVFTFPFVYIREVFDYATKKKRGVKK